MFTALIALTLLLLYSIFKPLPDWELNKFDTHNTHSLRGILAILIICCHFGQTTPQWPFIASWEWFGGPVVGCFFFLSGYGLAISYKTKGQTYITSFLQKRFYKLLPPFIIMTIAAWLFKHYYLQIPTYNLFQDWIHGFPPLNTSWYIYALILFYFIFYLGAKISRSPYKTGIVLIFSTVLYIITLYSCRFEGFWISSIPALSVGYFTALYEPTIRKLLIKNRITAIILIIIVIWSASLLTEIRRDILKPLVTTAIPIALYIQTLTASQICHYKFLNYLGDISYEIYLCQGFACIILPLVNPVVGMAIMFIGSIILAAILHIILNPAFISARQIRTR